MAVRWLGCDCEVLGVCWTVASGCSCVCGCFQYACHPPVIGLDIQDDMGRHEVGFQGDIAKIPVNDDSKSLLAVIIFLLLLSPVPPSPPPPPHTHTQVDAGWKQSSPLKRFPYHPFSPLPISLCLLCAGSWQLPCLHTLLPYAATNSGHGSLCPPS